MSVFAVEHLSKRFDNKVVLRDISLQVEPGEVVAIIGPSGSGKTTLLRCAALLEQIDSGRLSFGDLVAADENGYAPADILKQARGRFGLVFQNFNLFPHFSVLRNIMDAPVTVQKRPAKAVEQEAMALLDKMGLADRPGAYPFELSGGQQQRVSIARALAMHPDILFFDEPTSALDPELTNEILKVIRRLAEERMTMVIVTHEIDFASQVSDRIVFMADGVIVEEGRPEQLINCPNCDRTREFLSGFVH